MSEVLTLAKGDRLERAQSKAVLATELAAIGAYAGGPVGAAIGGLVGLIVGDQPMILQMDYVAIPAYEFSAVMAGTMPSHQILLKEGEVIRQMQPTEAQETAMVVEDSKPTRKRRRKKSAWNKFVAEYIKAYHKKHPKGKKSNATLMKEAAKKWKRVKK